MYNSITTLSEEHTDAENGQERRERYMTAEKKISAVIFDMDGIIFDTERLYLECWKQAGEEFGLEDIERVSRRMIGVNDLLTEKIFNDRYRGTKDYAACRKRVSVLFHSRYDGKIPLKPGVHEMLGFLEEQGIPFALASSTRIETVMRELREAGLENRFTRVIGGDMIWKSKPEPDIFLAAARQLDAEAGKCWVLEDSYNGIRAAAAAKMHPIMVPDMLEPTAEIRQLAEVICPSLFEAVAYLRGLL